MTKFKLGDEVYLTDEADEWMQERGYRKVLDTAKVVGVDPYSNPHAPGFELDFGTGWEKESSHLYFYESDMVLADRKEDNELQDKEVVLTRDTWRNLRDYHGLPEPYAYVSRKAGEQYGLKFDNGTIRYVKREEFIVLPS